MQYPPPPPVPSDVDPATLAALPLEFIAGEQQAELASSFTRCGPRPCARRPGNDVSRRRRSCALGPRGGTPRLSFCLWHYTLSTFWS